MSGPLAQLRADEQIVLNIDSNQYINAIKFRNRYIGFLIAGDTMLYKTFDGGKTWNHKFSFKYKVNRIDVLSKQTVVFHNMDYFSENSVIYVTNNDGEELSQFKVQEEATLEVYPNPAQNEVKIEAFAFKEAVILLKTLEGKEVYKGPFNQFRTIYTANFESGLYLVQLTDNERFQVTTLTILR